MDLFKSPLQERIEAATAETLLKEDKKEFIRICEMTLSEEDGIKDALKTIKKRIKNKNPKVVLITLSLLETMVINCGEQFHHRLISKDFLPDYVKYLKAPGINRDVQQRMLDLIQMWAVGLGYEASSPIVETHTQLLIEGLDFPPREMSSFTPISPQPKVNIQKVAQMRAMHSPSPFNPHGSPGIVLAPPGAATQNYLGQQQQYPLYQPMQPGQQYGPPLPYRPANLPPVQNFQQQHVQAGPPSAETIRKSLDEMSASVSLFNEMLTSLDPTSENVETNDLIQELNDSCRKNLEKLRRFLEGCEDEGLMIQLLELNDQYNSTFEVYDQCVATFHAANARMPGAQPPQPQPQPAHHARPVDRLISFDSDPLPPAVPVAAAAAAINSPPSGMYPLGDLQPAFQPYPQQPYPQAYPQQPYPPQPAAPSGFPPANPLFPPQPYLQPQLQPQPQGAMTQEELKIKEILGVDPDEFSEDQLAYDLANLGFTKEELLSKEKHDEAGGPKPPKAGEELEEDDDDNDDDDDDDGADDFEKLIDQRLAKPK